MGVDAFILGGLRFGSPHDNPIGRAKGPLAGLVAVVEEVLLELVEDHEHARVGLCRECVDRGVEP